MSEHTNEITEKLHIGTAWNVEHLPEDHEYDEVVTLNLYDEPGDDYPAASTTAGQFTMADGGIHDHETFVAAADFVATQLDHENTVLVHCTVAANRAPAVCAAALANHKNLPAMDALEWVEDRHPPTNPFEGTIDSINKYVKTDEAANADQQGGR